MPITVTCPNPNCAKQFQVKDEYAGKKGKCPGCQSPIVVPTPSAPVIEPPVSSPQKVELPTSVAIKNPAPPTEEESEAQVVRKNPRSRDEEDEENEVSERTSSRKNSDEGEEPRRSSRKKSEQDEEDDEKPRPSRKRSTSDEEDESESSSRRKSMSDEEDDHSKQRSRKRRTDEEEVGEDEEQPERKRKKSRPDSEPSVVLTLPKVVVRAKGFFGIGTSGSARTTHQIYEPGVKKPLAIVRKEGQPFSFKSLFKGLFGVSDQPVRLDIRENEDGDNLFTLEFLKSVLSQLVAKAPPKMTMDIIDLNDEMVAQFQFQGGLFSNKAKMRVVDAEGEELAEVRRLSSSTDGIGLALIDPNGQTLGTVRTEAMDDVAETLKDGKARMSFSAGGSEGHVAEISEAFLGNPTIHRLVVSLAIIVEATGIGKKDTGDEPMRPSSRRRR